MRAGIFLIMFLTGTVHAQDFVVVTSSETRLDQLSHFQLKQIYLGKILRLKGEKLTPLQVKGKDPLRQSFETTIFDPHFDLDNYWLARKLDADASPPRTVGSWVLVLAYVERNPGFIGYIPKENLADLKSRKVKILLIEK